MGRLIPHTEEPQALRRNGHWRMAVWALRAGYLAVAIAVVGLIVTVSGSTPFVLALGILGWLTAAAVTLTGVFWARHELPDPKPGLWPMRFMLIRDSVSGLASAPRP